MGWAALPSALQSLWIRGSVVPEPQLREGVRSEHHPEKFWLVKKLWDLNLMSKNDKQASQIYRGRTLQYSTWTSWTDFVVIAGFAPSNEWDFAEAVEQLTQKMPEHAGAVLGLPEPPATHQVGRSKEYEYKQLMAENLIKHYLEKENLAAWRRLLAKIEDEDDIVSVMKSIV